MSLTKVTQTVASSINAKKAKLALCVLSSAVLLSACGEHAPNDNTAATPQEKQPKTHLLIPMILILKPS